MLARHSSPADENVRNRSRVLYETCVIYLFRHGLMSPHIIRCSSKHLTGMLAEARERSHARTACVWFEHARASALSSKHTSQPLLCALYGRRRTTAMSPHIIRYSSLDENACGTARALKGTHSLRVVRARARKRALKQTHIPAPFVRLVWPPPDHGGVPAYHSLLIT